MITAEPIRATRSSKKIINSIAVIVKGTKIICVGAKTAIAEPIPKAIARQIIKRRKRFTSLKRVLSYMIKKRTNII